MVGHPATSIKTTQVAAYFELTAFEAHQALERFVEDGLLSFKGLEDGVEAWEFSRDGAYVFRERAKRLTRKDVKAAREGLIGLTTLLLSEGALEVSIGGRPVIGKANGMLLVGIRVAHEPFSSPIDALIVEQVARTLDDILQQHGYSVLLFQDAIPERLRTRTVLAGVGSGNTVEALASECDVGEKLQNAYRAAYATLRGISDEDLDSYFSNIPGEVPRGVLNFLFHEWRGNRFPVACQHSSVRVLPDYELEATDLILDDPFHLDDIAFAQLEYAWEPQEYGHRLPTFIAEADYSAATGNLESFCKAFIKAFLKVYRLPRTKASARDARASILFSLARRRTSLREKRSATAARKSSREPVSVQYFAFFDTLNFPQPVLAGFARQPTTHYGNIKALTREWDVRIGRKEGSPAELLRDSGFPVGYLSLDRRPATPSEIAAYNRLSKAAGVTLKCLLVEADEAVGRTSLMGYKSHPFKDIPEELRKAKLGRAPRPRLVTAWQWRDSRTEPLFGVIENAPVPIRTALEANIVNIDTVSFDEFAQAASLRPCVAPVVLASGLLDCWTFSAHKGGWLASITGHEWSVALIGCKETLRLRVALGDNSHEQQISPTSGQARGGHPYVGLLGSLLPFLEHMASMRDIDLNATRNAMEGPMDSKTRRSLFAWFVEIVSDALHGWGLFSNATEFLSVTSWTPLAVPANDSSDNGEPTEA